jgi:hypothetical protein
MRTPASMHCLPKRSTAQLRRQQSHTPGIAGSHPGASLAADEGRRLVSHLDQRRLRFPVAGWWAGGILLASVPRAQRLQGSVGAAPSTVIKLVLQWGTAGEKWVRGGEEARLGAVAAARWQVRQR